MTALRPGGSCNGTALTLDTVPVVIKQRGPFLKTDLPHDSTPLTNPVPIPALQPIEISMKTKTH